MNRNTKRGFITTIIIVVAAILLLRYWFGFNIIDFLKSPQVAEWTAYLREVFTFLWENYLGPAVTAVIGFIINLFRHFKS